MGKHKFMKSNLYLLPDTSGYLIRWTHRATLHSNTVTKEIAYGGTTWDVTQILVLALVFF